jgi:hypothetical protein
MSLALRLIPALALLGLLPAPATSQQFLRNTSDIPASSGYTENVDFADIDLDGDWDAAFANGGDFGNQQSALWVNLGGLQGGQLGTFVDATAGQFPVILADSRDIEFADIDGDADVDLYLVDTCTIVNQPCRWWVNQGGLQGGTIGFYQDETATRWVGLGQPGSSLPPQQVLGSGGFVDFPSDADFADFDNDGDLDLVHSTSGPAFSGSAPTRIFQNDGSGHFSEYNPSGFQLSGTNIANGNPGLWCEGTQLANTTDATGTNCDIATSCIDVDIADIDGDLDLDILLGARSEAPRMFQNRYAEKGGVPGFRDVTGAVFPPGYVTGTGHYAQELGDMDGDGDWDILGLGWLVTFGQFNDATYFNNGSGVFGPPTVLPSSAPDDSEVDFFDYDEDGDLDLYFANFSGQDRAYQNNGAGAYTFMPTGTVLPVDTTNSLDADTCDVDGDGDTDVFVANDGGQAEWYLQNMTLANDTAAPSITQVEQAPNRSAGPAPTVVRARVQDNSAYYTSWYMQLVLRVQVNGGPPTDYPMRSSMGQVFRGAIPGSLAGSIDYRVVATDEHGNTSSSAPLNYFATAGGTLGTPFCFGDGTLVPCPCANSGSAGHGCENSSSSGGSLLTASGAVLPDSVVFQADGLVPNVLVILLQGSASLPAPIAFGDGLRCFDGTLLRLYVVNAAGSSASVPPPGAAGVRVISAGLGDLLSPGATRVYQAWYRDPDLGYCPAPAGSAFNTSNGLQITW